MNGKAKGKTCASSIRFGLGWRANELACGASSPLRERGPLTPPVVVLVVGEGQVNFLVYGRLKQPWPKSPNFVVDDESSIFRLRFRLRHWL